MRRFYNYIILAILSSVYVTRAYFIDDDCTTEQKAFLTRAISNAAQLNTLAEATLGSPSTPAETQLLEWLFGTDLGTRQRLSATLTSINNVFTPHGTAAELTRMDFHLYCTTKRFKTTTTKKGLKWYDPDMGENWAFRTRFNCEVATAYTSVPKDPNTPSSIQMCPWFLDYTMGKDPAFQNEIKPDVMTRLAQSLREFVAESKYSDIDFVGLIDKVMLHEITHTRGGGSTEDVGGWSGYGWKNARKLSTVVTTTDPTVPEDQRVDGPERNADSIAIFATACRMIADGITINEDGTFAEPPTTAPPATAPPATEPPARRIKRMIVAMRTRSIFGFH